MLIIVAYYVETQTADGQRRLRRVARICLNYGQRVQNSVFECAVDSTQYAKLKIELYDEIDRNRDSIRFYKLAKDWENKIETLGRNETYNPEGELIV